MRVLYIGNYADGTGWGNAALNNIIAMNRCGIDVIPRRVRYSEGQINLPSEVLSLENKELKNIDAYVQHTLPTDFYYSTLNDTVKPICMFETENTSFKNSKWNKYINMFDNIWTPNNIMIDHMWHSGVKVADKKIYYIPHCIDTNIYKNFQPVEQNIFPQNSYNFCFVGEMNKRKNIGAIIKAFHLAFHPAENVNLFFKLSGGGFRDNNEGLKFFYAFHDQITSSMKIRKKYKSPYVMFGRLSQESLLSHMSQCHCFVSASYGEAWCIPALEAMALGLDLIYTEKTGLSQFACAETSSACKARETPCFDALDTLPELYSSNDSWMEIDIDELSHLMRKHYVLRNSTDKNKTIEQAMKFDYENTGNKIRRSLDDICSS